MDESERRPVILMVDDEDDFLSVVKLWAEPEYEFIGKTDGEDLLEEVEALSPALVVLDVVMPGVGGFELCRRLRADPRFAAIPILFLTGSRKDEDFLRNMEVGGTAFVTKPVGRRRLVSLFHELTGVGETVDTAASD
ncbi:MAG: response regulator [Elusimicrobia bacterium]|nr:response regulator [Elusimicrobiota bacterium]